MNSDINIYMKPTIAEAVRGIDASDEVPFKTDVASIGEGDEVTLTYQGATLYPGTYDFGCRLYWELPGAIPDRELTTSQSPTTPVVVDGYGQFYGSANKSKLTECKAANPAPLAGQSVELRTHGFWRQGDVARYFSGRVYVSHGGDIVENFFGFLPFDLFEHRGLRTLAKKSYTFDSPGVYTMDCELYSHPSAYPPSDPFASLTDKIRAGLAAYFSPASVTGGLQSFRGVMTNTFTVVEARWGDDQVSISPNPLPQGGGTITVQVHTEESTTKQTAVPAPMFSIQDLSESKTAGTCGHNDLSGYTRRCWEATFTIPENDSFESISHEVAVSSGQITGTRTGSFAVAPLPPPSVDRPALVALYNATGGANWPVKTNWLSNNPVGEWQGVTTDVERGRVTRLDLLGNRLSGEIPVELGSLSNLKLLDLGANGLSGEIPVELGSLSNLESLDLGANRLRGNIPVQLGNLTSLLWLELTDNQLSGNIPTSLGRLTNLEILDLGENKLTGSIPPELGSMTNLDTLHLNDNELSGEIPELAGLANLVSLRLDGNRLTGCIPQGLRGADTNDLAQLNLPFCDVLLSGLTINPGTLSPQFQSSHTDYTTEAGQLRITVVPTNDHNATFQFLDENDAGIPDADDALDGHQVDLGDGITTIKVKVTSQDNGASHTYTIRVTTVGLPGAPAITTPITSGAASLTVSWTAPPGGTVITSYGLRYIESSAVDKTDANWTVVEDTRTTGSLNYTIEGLTGGVQYDVQVRAVSSVGTGPWSATSSGAPQATPGAPEITGPITPGAASLTVSWTAPPGGTVITSYGLRYIESSAVDKTDANWTVVEDTRTTGSLNYTIEGLTGGVQYDVQVRAVSSVGTGPWSATSSGAPQATPGAPEITGPITPGDSALTVEWSAPATDGGSDVTGYDLRYIESSAVDKADANWTVMEDIWTTGSLIYTIEGLTGGAQYDVQVRAVSSVGAGPWSATSTGVPQATPGAPAIGSLTPGDSALTVEWSAPATDGGSDVTGYDLRYIRSDALDKADANWTVRSSIWNSGGLRYDLEGLTNGAAYEVQVRAVNVSGTGPWSETFTGTPATWWAIRSLSPESVEPGGEVEVTITAAGYGALGQVMETLPDGFSYLSSSLSGVEVVGQTITFTLLAETEFTYTVTASSIDRAYSFSGVLRNENLVERPVGGFYSIIVTTAAAPSVEIARSTAIPVRLNSPIPVTATFSEPVFGFTANDIVVGNGIAGGFTGSDGDAVYTFEVRPSAIGAVTVDIDVGAAKDADDNGSTAARRLTLGITYDDDRDGSIGRGEAIAAIVDYFAGRLTRGQTIAVIVLYFSSGN